MIDENSITAALAAAEAGLEDEGCAWIKRSALTERAYFLGLYKGLSALAAESQLNRLSYRALVQTMHVRPGDDTFAAGQLARTHAALGQDLKALRNDGPSAADAALQRLAQCLAEIEDRRNSASKQAARLLAALHDLVHQRSAARPDSDDLDQRALGAYADLDPLLRVLDLPRPWWQTMQSTTPNATSGSDEGIGAD
jgi:hypothetical protein